MNGNSAKQLKKRIFMDEELEKKSYEENIKKEEEFKKQVASDLSKETDEMKDFIYSLIEKDSDDVKIESSYGLKYTIRYIEGTPTTNPNSIHKSTNEPSNINIDINENEIRIHYFDSNTGEYLDRYMVLDILPLFNEMKDDLYKAYLKNMKTDFKKCLNNAYKITKMDRSKKIKEFLGND